MMPIAPSVAMNGGSWTTITSSEITRPDITPTSSPARTLGVSGHPASTKSPPVTTLAKAITAPGERSMPPEMMTIAAPMAAMP
jgi:hypothetical protein